MLKSYIQFIIAKQHQRLLSTLTEKKSVKLDTLLLSLKLARENAERALKSEIDNLGLTIAVAKAAGVEHPLENYNNGERFPIMLGTKGLMEKLALLKAIDLVVYQPQLQELQAQINHLKEIKLEDMSFTPFSYLDSPDAPLSRDKPKRPLIVVLATLFGGMLGVAIVLVRHAFRRSEEA